MNLKFYIPINQMCRIDNIIIIWYIKNVSLILLEKSVLSKKYTNR